MLTLVPATKDLTLHVDRVECSEKSTVGHLFIDGVFKWYTLEDALHDGPKIPGATCIPAGRYQVVMSFSNRFQRVLPLLLNVPGFTGVRIHPGNTDKDTAGCLLVGGAVQLTRGVEPMILHSAPACEDVNQIIAWTIQHGWKVYVEVVNPLKVPKNPTPWASPIAKSA